MRLTVTEAGRYASRASAPSERDVRPTANHPRPESGMQSSGQTPVFVGRAAEIDLLASELSVVRAGTSRLVLVEGTAGIGKTALIDRLLSGENDLTVLRA